MSIKQSDVLIILRIFTIIVCAIGRITLIFRLQVINLKLLVVYIKHGLLQLLFNSLIFFFRVCEVHQGAVVMIKVSEELSDLGYYSALILLGQAFTSYFQDKACRYLISASSDPEQPKVSIELLRHLVALVLQTVKVDSLNIYHRDAKLA